MSIAIDSVTISSIEDRRIVLGNSQIARVLDIGKNFTRIRIALRLAFDDSGGNLAGTPHLWIGLLSNPSASMANGPLTNATSHFCGIVTKNTTWTRATSPVKYDFTGLEFYPIVRVGSTNTTGTNIGSASSPYYSASPSTNRSVILLEITRGSPNFTLQATANANSSVPDISLSSLTTQMGISSLSTAASNLGLTTAGNAQTIAVDEATNGDLNAVCVAWDRLDSLVHVSDLMWANFGS